MRKLLVATLQESHRLWGLFIVDREWQPTGVTDSDVCSLKAFLRHAGQILRQHRAFHETMKHRDLSALGFIAKGLTHDLSDPIGVLQLDTGTFSRAVEEAEWLKARSCAQRIQTNVDRMVGTLSAFSSFLRPFDEFEVVDIARLLSTLHTLCYQCAKDHGITFAIEIRVPDGQRHVALRQGALRQALINLVANAEQALGRVARRDKRIQVTAEIEGGSLRIEGYDNGPGIPDRELQDVQRSRSGYTTDPMKGYGFGLELVRDAAEAHDGSFVLQSQEGIGTTAIIRIPLAVIEAP